MNLFFSGVGKDVIEADPRLGSPRYRLFSCHGAYFKYAMKTSPMCAMIDDRYEILLDSGAFTAWTKGEEVKLPHLIDAYSQLIDVIGDIEKVWLINLDKIPGSPGVTASTAEVEEAIKISDENFEVLKDTFGDRVLPVFHQNEDWARLETVKSMASYICVSPRNDLGEKYRREWSKEIHTRCAGTRTHGLATTGYAMMTTVPWHSVDSATWIMIAAYGHIYANTKLEPVTISSDSPRKYERGKHYDHLQKDNPLLYDKLQAQFDEWGFTEQGLQNDFVERATWNRIMMSDLYRSVGEITAPVQISLHDL